ncbi:alpha/beta hydrolase [Sphingosinicellaceae bacterium]|nr:alpha/beta hydrolase [Sphingosinicellaceae bacterium]
MQTITRRSVIGIGLALVGTALLASCSSLGTLRTLNDLTPGDGGTSKVGDGVAYGIDPLQRLDVYAPRDASNARVIVFFYGGSWATGSRDGYGFVGHALAARGFVVVVPDYRKVPAVHFPAFVDDGAAAMAWVRANVGRYGGDPARVAVAGHSAGAYIAAMLALEPGRVPPGSIKAFVGLAGPYDFYPFEPGGSAEAAFGRNSDPRVNQPISFASAAAPPSLLLTGHDDTTVKPRNATSLAAKLKAAGASAQVIDYPGIGHIGLLLALSKPFRGKAPALDDMTKFLDPTL